MRRLYKYSNKILIVFVCVASWAGLAMLTGSACVLQATAGIPCPGCGLIRATLSLFHGDFAEAFRWHPLVFITLPLLAALLASIALKIKPPRSANRLLLGVFALYIAVYIGRMVILFPHTQPMVPHDNALWRQALRFIRGLIS